MLNITGLNRFYYLCNFYDLRCKNSRVLSIIHQQLNREPEEDRDDFDGTLSGGNIPQASGDMPDVLSGKRERPYRKGMSYKRMQADKSVCHVSDLSRLSEGSVVIKTFYKYAYEQVIYILEHRYEVVRYKIFDGKLREAYLSKEGEFERIDVVPGTHASGGFLVHLAFNHFCVERSLLP